MDFGDQNIKPNINLDELDEEIIDFGMGDSLSDEGGIDEGSGDTEEIIYNEETYGEEEINENSDTWDDVDYDVIEPGDGFIVSGSGEIVVQDIEDDGTRFELKYIDINAIVVTQRIRVTKDYSSLVKSIQSTGLLQPLIVAPLATQNLYVLISGFRRLIACAKAGIKQVPCIINKKIRTTEIPLIEAIYNHVSAYTMPEIVRYIDFLNKEKGMINPTMIEYLLQMNSGDYSKLKDILTDNDDDIVGPLMEGQVSINQAFKKLEQRRKKESKDEQDERQAGQVYDNVSDSGADQIQGYGEEGDESSVLTLEELNNITVSVESIKQMNEESLDSIIEEGDSIEGYEARRQRPDQRKALDKDLSKAVLARDNNTCQACKVISGQEYTSVLDCHHIMEVYVGGLDAMDNLIALCTVCHKLVHLYARGELHIRPANQLSMSEVEKFKRIAKLGLVIRKALKARGMKIAELKKLDKAETIGRTKPGTPNQVAS